MKVYVLTRTDNFDKPRRIIEGVFSSREKGEAERQAMLKRYDAPSKLCIDTELSEHEVEQFQHLQGKTGIKNSSLFLFTFLIKNSIFTM